MIALLDYGAGNVGSVLKAVQYLGFAAQPVSCPELLSSAEKLILPGQGHFGAMMTALEDRRVLSPLKKMIETGTPYFGICLGYQALHEGSDESPQTPGLGLLPGRVKRFEGVFKVPQVGWNQLEIRSPSRMFEGVLASSFAYFCHSFYSPVTDETTAVSDYGQIFAAATEKNNIWAVQFHPEKSGDLGLKVLRNFLEM